MSLTSKNVMVEIELPQDIIFAMRGPGEQEEIKKKLKMALAIILFHEKSISLGKATELAGINRVRFMEVLKEYGISPYEYREKDLEKDLQAVESLQSNFK